MPSKNYINKNTAKAINWSKIYNEAPEKKLVPDPLEVDENKKNYISKRTMARKRGTFATIDLGTNNCRMLIAQPTPHSFQVVESFARVTRLGESIIETEKLSDDAMARTIKALKICANKMSKRPISQARYVATEACRRAKNTNDFLNLVYKETGLTFEVISAEEESRLAVTGCVPLLNRNIFHTLVFDIGGGSTEISWAKVNPKGKTEIEGAVSLPFGVVTVSEAFTGVDLDKNAYQAVWNKTKSILTEFEKKHQITKLIESSKVQIIGTSGTITTIGAIHLELPRYNRQAVDGMNLRIQEIHKVQEMIKKMTKIDRIAHPCIGPLRADLTLAGCAIFEAICKFWPIEEITVADRGLREGVLLDLMQRNSDRVSSKETCARAVR
ncbi:MAG: Ppx/GppA phosphatase family protein [Alphaproteobacteria bacterium]